MTRHIQHTLIDVYDDETDQLYRCDTPEEARAFAMEVEAREAVTVEPQAPTRFSTATIPVSLPAATGGATVSTQPIQLLASDMSRYRARISCVAGTNALVLVVGTRADIMSGKGYQTYVAATTSEDFPLETTDDIWCMVQSVAASASTGVVSAISEYRG